ncbi:MAG: peptidase domain-containing ABC transporter [Cyanobacteria bacterium P01_G01_bin.39]
MDQIKVSSSLVDKSKSSYSPFRFWKSYPFVGQDSISDPGIACLAMISLFWEMNVSINFLNDLADWGESGISFKNLTSIAERLGHQIHPMRASLSSLIDRDKPWIAQWSANHYVVVYRIKKNKVLIADPSIGKRYIDRGKFLENWTGYALLLEPKQKKLSNNFLSLLDQNRFLCIQILLATFFIQIFGLALPVSIQIILDKVLVDRNLNVLFFLVLGVFILRFVSIILSAFRQYLLSYLSNNFNTEKLEYFISHLLKLPLRFFESYHLSYIITRINENKKVKEFLINKIGSLCLDLLMGFIYIALMLYYSWKLTTLAVIIAILCAGITIATTPLSRKIFVKSFNQLEEQNSALIEIVRGVDVIKTTALEKELHWRWKIQITNFLKSQFRSQRLAINLQAANNFVRVIGSSIFLWFGATQIIYSQLTIGQFVALGILLRQMFEPVISLSEHWLKLQEALISQTELNEILKAEPEVISANHLLTLPEIKGEVAFDNVTFRHNIESENNALQNVSFDIKRGETIAVIGQNNSGKTTMVKLLQGLYQPSTGIILIDGNNLRHISLQSLRSQIGFLSQDCHLFPGTILENITLCRPQYSLEQVIEVTKLTQVDSFIRAMPLGYQTTVDKIGSNLSRTQKQKITLSRIYLTNPRIVIMDGLDSFDLDLRRIIIDNFKAFQSQTTILTSTHPLSSFCSSVVDKILVMDRGHIVEQGTHEDLKACQGFYYYMLR